MYSRLREQFSTAALILSALALVFALLGGAYAASQESPRKTLAAKGKRGPRGPKGPQGEAGPKGDPGAPGAIGAIGAPGAPGAPGKDGLNGKEGKAGKDGESVTVEEFLPGESEVCEETGGVLIEGGEPPAEAEVCNGKEGKAGKDGKDGTFNPSIKLGPGQIETGAWAFAGNLANGQIRVPISLPVPLNLDIETEETQRIWFTGETDFALHCGTFASPAVANPAELCVYSVEPLSIQFKNATFGGAFKPSGGAGLGTSGGFLKFTPTADGAVGTGFWKVRGCDPTKPEGEPEHCPEF